MFCLIYDIKYSSDAKDQSEHIINFHKYYFSSGGAGKITMEKLESSIAHIKDMFKERANIMENMTSSNAPTAFEKEL